MLDLCLYLSTKEREVKNKLSVILAITGALTMGNATADNWSPWGNNNNYNPFSGGNNSFGPFGAGTNFGPFGGGNNIQPFGFNSGVQPFGFDTRSNRFGPMNGNNMGPFNGGHNWQNQSFNPMKVAQQTADTVQETVAEATTDSSTSPKMTAELFMQMVQVTEVDEDITGPEVDESIKSMATNESILHVAMFPLSEQIKNVTGKPYRHLSIHNICDAATAGKIADIDDRYAVILPCRIAVVEGKDGKIRMISMNPDVMHAMQLPEDALGPAMDVAEKMNAILEGAKEGSF